MQQREDVVDAGRMAQNEMKAQNEVYVASPTQAGVFKVRTPGTAGLAVGVAHYPHPNRGPQERGKHNNETEKQMNKQELVNAVAEKADVTNAEGGKVVNAIIEAITAALTEGDDVTIPGFGKFTISERSARTGRNPQTGATIQIAASKAPAFKAGKALKDAVNG